MIRTSVHRFGVLLFVCFCVTIQGNPPCGMTNTRTSSAKLQPKIIRGYEVGYYKYPWYATLEIESEVFCGGALIGNRFVLTAAHCYDDARGQNLENYYKIRTGVYRQCKKDPTQTVYKVSKVYIHEKYKANKPYYDIALLKLSADTTAYMPICLPRQVLKDSDYEPEAFIAGFGSTVENNENSYPCEMREGRILTYDSVTCRKMVENLSEDEIKYARYINAICAGYKSGTIDTCQGDSGGPLMVVDSLTNRWHQVGVTSFGWGCGHKNQLGVYTDVSKYLDWIEDISGIKPTDYDNTQTISNNNNNNNVNNNDLNDYTTGSASNWADSFNKIFDHMMQSEHPPVEITFRFKDKPRSSKNKHRHHKKGNKNV